MRCPQGQHLLHQDPIHTTSLIDEDRSSDGMAAFERCVGERRQVTIVEDDVSVRRATERLFRAAGYATAAFASAEAMLAAKRVDCAECLVVDICLPGLSGFELEARLVEAGISTPVIFITGHDEPHLRQQAERTGAVAYLPKPWAGATLLAAVARAFNEKSQDKEH